MIQLLSYHPNDCLELGTIPWWYGLGKPINLVNVQPRTSHPNSEKGTSMSKHQKDTHEASKLPGGLTQIFTQNTFGERPLCTYTTVEST